MRHIKSKEDYIKYFSRMQEENKTTTLSGTKWNWIIAYIHQATKVDKVFTTNELADMFPDLLEDIIKDLNIIWGECYNNGASL